MAVLTEGENFYKESASERHFPKKVRQNSSKKFALFPGNMP